MEDAKCCLNILIGALCNIGPYDLEDTWSG